MDDKLFDKLYPLVMKMLRDQLPPHLYYHNPEHTIDVIESAERIAVSEECSRDEILLLKIAALFHDTGYVLDMRDHERHGCEIANEMLSVHLVQPAKINVICSLIMSTKVPQSPQTKLEEIICDADLDYLGRSDYFPIAENLYREFRAFEKINSEKDWIDLQLNFLRSHTYFTKTSVKLRQSGKQENLVKIRVAL